jgi:glycine cleavage system H protein
MKFPQQYHYTSEHLWARQDANGNWLAGITDYAQDLLGDIVYIEPPKVGDTLINGKPCGIVESVKTGSDLHAPMNGTVTEINNELLGAPEGINDKPYEAWIFKFNPTDANETEHFLTAEAYAKHVNED